MFLLFVLLFVFSLSSREVPSDDPRRRKPDISKAMKHLNWEPKTKLQDGLQKTIADFKARHEAGDF